MNCQHRGCNSTGVKSVILITQTTGERKLVTVCLKHLNEIAQHSIKPTNK